MARLKLGEILEISTPKGKAYLHYIYKDNSTGELIRVLPGLFSEIPAALDKLAASKEDFMVFFPLSAAANRKIVERVGYYPPDNFHKPKHMRTEHTIRGEFLGWHIVDTETLKRQLVKTLTSEQIELSPWGTWNDTLLIENLANDWSLQKWS